MTKKEMPCYGCTERNPGCHSMCSKYANAKVIMEREKQQKREENFRRTSCYSAWHYDMRGIKSR